MTNTALAIPNTAVDINRLFGFQEKAAPSIPYLKVNGTAEDEGIGAPKGTFVLDNGSRVLYAETATIRIYVKGLQYRLYHPKDSAKNDMSIIANSFRAEFRSISGRIACGKLPNKQFAELGDNVSPQQKELQDSVKCKLIVFGLVSGKFKDVETGDEVDVTDELFMWVTSQSSYMVMDSTIRGIEKERRPIPCTPIKLKLKKEKSGSVTYFVPMPEVTNDSVKLNAEVDLVHLEKIKKFINETNHYVNEKYNAAIKDKAVDTKFDALGAILDGDPLSL